MNIILPAGLCSFILSVYFLRLMADGKKLERRLLERRTESSDHGQGEEELLIKDAYATWMALPSCAARTVGRACDVEFYPPDLGPSSVEEGFGQLVIPDPDRRYSN